jgi:hopanoid biosynthesis associated radical SAM protein HpnH
VRFPVSLYTSLSAYFAKNALNGKKRFPLVLMLEPTHRCNLSCPGCDRIRLYQQQRTDDLTLSACMDAVLSSGAPVVTITGGEPMLYAEIIPLVRTVLDLKRHVYLCTNGILTPDFIDSFAPHARLTLNFHVDGLGPDHDRATREGTFEQVIAAIRGAKEKGYRVSTNTSVFRNTSVAQLDRLFAVLKNIGVDGMLISPAFPYERVEGDLFLTREEAVNKFRQMHFFNRYPFLSSPLYLDFLRGKRRMRCTPWGNPTRNPLGWKSPCYLITDRYYATFQELMEQTDWERYESGQDPRCRDCMVHSGYEATVQRIAFSRPKDLLRLAIWNLRGR